MGGGAYGINTDLEYHASNSIAIVEGTARIAGPARFGDVAYRPDMDRAERWEAVTGISTPFTIQVSRTHKGPEKAEWTVFEPGGLVGCASYRRTDDGVRLFDGAMGLFFIQAEGIGRQGDQVSMTIAEDGPEWFFFTESRFGQIDEAVAIIGANE